jgi:3-carboxy-cis,cis-muconate cycloisomerase
VSGGVAWWWGLAEGLFRPIFVPDAFSEALSGRAWLQAMLDAEAALAAAEARVGVIPAEAAAAIASCCDAGLFDVGEVGHGGRAAGNPVPALVRALTGEVSKASEPAARHVHRGATSQDITDTAAMLVTRRALDPILAEVDGIADACARLAGEHRGTLMAGRTLLQQALPTTFGLKAAGWLVSVLEARRRLREVRASGLAAQLGGAAGTLASLGKSGLPVLREFALELGLAEPPVPWHTDRTRVSNVGNALSLLAGVLAKISRDIILMAQTEVGEVAEPAGEGRGGSSTLPHKRNPILSVTAAANARRVQDLARTLGAAMAQEHERAAGAWHAEWETLSDALALAGGAAANVREATEGLEVYPEKMRENLGATGGMLLAENVTTAVSEKLGRLDAHDLVEAACRRALEGGGHLREELAQDTQVRAVLSEAEIDAALDPAGYLGSAGAFVDRALALYRGEAS